MSLTHRTIAHEVTQELFAFYSSQVIHSAFSVNNSVDMISLSECDYLIICSQFIERTEMDGNSQQIEVGLLKDNPR